MSEYTDKITQTIGRSFRSFGGGQTSFNNPISAALKDKPLQFAAGVDIKAVVEAVLSEVGFEDLVKACEELSAIFPESSMSEMDAADFKDRANRIWVAAQGAKAALAKVQPQAVEQEIR